jgi:hypothetical protein
MANQCCMESNSGASFELKPNEFVSQDKKVSSANAKITQPYWLEKEHGIGSYVVDSLSKIGLAENPVGLSGLFKVKIGDEVIEKRLPAVYKYTDQVRGEIYQPLVIAPPVTATLVDRSFIFNGNESKKITLVLKSFKDNASGVLEPKVPEGWKVVPAKIDFTINRKGEEQRADFTVTPAGAVSEGVFFY